MTALKFSHRYFNSSASGCYISVTPDLSTRFPLTPADLILLKFYTNYWNFLLFQNIYVLFGEPTSECQIRKTDPSYKQRIADQNSWQDLKSIWLERFLILKIKLFLFIFLWFFLTYGIKANFLKYYLTKNGKKFRSGEDRTHFLVVGSRVSPFPANEGSFNPSRYYF